VGAAEADDAPKYTLSAWLYPRLLALIVGAAFISIWVQLDGLVGDTGLAPVAELVARLDARELSFFDHPTLARLWPSAGALGALSALGVLASTTLFLGVFPRTSLLVAWLAYLSIVNAGFPFTAFQWDTLLLEVLLASTLYVSTARIDRRDGATAHPIGRWVMWLLLFRLMLRSGVVKLASGDEAWADLTALTFHYESQPLPTVFGWYAHQLPEAVQRASCLAMFAIELALPLLIFVPRRGARRTAAAGFAALMLLILITGNYGFFNLLTLLLCLTLVDDRALKRLMPAALVRFIGARDAIDPPPTWARRVHLGASSLLILVASIGFVTGLVRADVDPISVLRPFRSINDYGLFAVMTKGRPEVEIEGSHDGETWRTYRFRYKVGPLDRAPVWNTPHQPRLDWQMWFAALGDHRRNPWLHRLMERLAARDRAVLRLIEEDPFEGEDPPRFVRARLFDFRMTSFTELRETGHYWHREPRSLYAPVLRVQ